MPTTDAALAGELDERALEAAALDMMIADADQQRWGRCIMPREVADTLSQVAVRAYLASAPRHPVQITMQDVRLHAGEGPLKAADVLAACNAFLRSPSAHRFRQQHSA